MVFLKAFMVTMAIFKTKREIREQVQQAKGLGLSVGFVPTMGALHAGHMSLVRKAAADNDVVIVSIFVNPTQFDNANDLEKYPKTLEADKKLLLATAKEVLIFAPSAQEMYNGHITSNTFDFDGLENVMEGKFRKGHFNGVGTVVELLLTIVEPDNAYFGEKDFQQLQIIKKLVSKGNYPFKIIACPIAREANGLAMSSRNLRLSESMRKSAGFIFEILQAAKSRFGTENALHIKEWVQSKFEANALFDLEYFQIAETETLRPIDKKEVHKKYRAFIAVYAEGVRLIDNIALN